MPYPKGRKVNVTAYFSHNVQGVQEWEAHTTTELVKIVQVVNDDDRYNDDELYWVRRSDKSYTYMIEEKHTQVDKPEAPAPFDNS